MRRFAIRAGFLALASLLAFAGTAQAASTGHQEPASLLIYPIYDSNPGAVTLINVTNTNGNQAIDLVFIYIDGSTWREFNRFEHLTPYDHLSVTAAFHNPDSAQGFLYVYAIQGGEPADFDYLIGDEIVADSLGNFLYAIDAIGFESKGADKSDWTLRFDDRDYCRVPDRMIASSFIGQSTLATSTLILVALIPNGNYESLIGFKVFNNNEQEFSTSFSFRCWAAVDLLDISNVFSDAFLKTTNYDDGPNGFTENFGPTTGWFEMDGIQATDVVGNEPMIHDPPFVGAFVQTFRVGSPNFSTGRLLHGSREKNSTHGGLNRF